MVRGHHWLSGHEFEQTPSDSEDRGAWHAATDGVSKSQAQLGNRTAAIYKKDNS